MSSDPPINLDGKVKLSTGTLIAIVVVVFALAGIYFKIPTATDLERLIRDHNDSSDSHPNARLAELRAKTIAIDFRAERLEERQNDTHKDVEYIRERVDFLTEQSVKQATRNEALQRTTVGRAKQAASDAVERLRSGAGPKAAVQTSLDQIGSKP